MSSPVVMQIAAIVVLGVAAQWLASLLRLPSILLLLLAGFLAGPISGFLDPDRVLPGDLLPAMVSLSLAVILFEGGLTLRLSEAQEVGAIVTRLVSVGVLVTWAAGSYAAHALLGLEKEVAALLGAILVLSGPTVVTPLLRSLRPEGRSGAILKWEAIVIDPVGVLLAALVFQAITESHTATATVLAILKTLLVGSALGSAAAGILLLVLKRRWVPDALQAPVTLGILIAAYVAANTLQHESGLLAVIVMGFLLANQKQVSVHHIVSFKEHLTLLLIASLFVVLAARIPVEAVLRWIDLRGVSYLLVLVLLVRPLAVFVSTVGSGLALRERCFLAWMCPRGIVAAASAPFFALHLGPDTPGAREIVPLTFLVIVGTVSVYGLSAGLVARLLGITHPDPQGILILGAHHLARELASTLKSCGTDVVLVDTNRQNVATARLAGLDARVANVLSEEGFDQLELGGIGKLLALTPNDEVNALACVHGLRVFGSTMVFQLPPEGARSELPAAHLRGHIAFRADLSYWELAQRLRQGAVIKKTTLSKDFDQSSFEEHYGASALPLLWIGTEGNTHVVEAGAAERFPLGATVVSLVESEAA